MLSICIPIYNYDVSNLVKSLHWEGSELAIPFEILLIDDASDANLRKPNEHLSDLAHVTYIQLNENIGRSKIRNLLAEKANYDSLIFLDCDAETTDKSFIKNYLPYLNLSNVVCGGTRYKRQHTEKQYRLRYLYGISKEETTASERNKNPYKGFSAFNFFIPKDVFGKLSFNDRLIQYGHEDTLFGIELKKQNIPIIHIDNPLYHTGLDENKIYLEKNKRSIENIYFLAKQIQKEDVAYFNVLNALYKIKRLKLVPLFSKIYILFHSYMEKLLIKKHPFMLLFSFYKLSYLSYLFQKEETQHSFPATTS